MSIRTRLPRRSVASLVVTAVALVAFTGCSAPDDNASTIVETTTRIAGAGVVGIERDTATACATPTPLDGGLAPDSTHPVTHTLGETQVPADPQRIVVLDPAALDTVCALGLWERVVGAATVEGESPQPAYLGSGISEIPGVGPVGAPDLDLIAQAAPDLILGSSPASDGLYEGLEAIAPTVFAGSDPVYWKAQFQVAAGALGRTEAAAASLEQYQEEAAQTGLDIDATQTQASVVSFGTDSLTISGPASFAGQVLTDAGVRRPHYQRLEESATEEISEDDLSKAEGDLIYVGFDGPEAQEHGTEVMRSEGWEDLEAATDNRVFAVDNSIWKGNGLVAARAIVGDLRESLNAYVS
ncbi:iron-siderophore ABC transporter substrate-binding protein [Rhodococcus sp. NPDC058521]|uniref:iron-siderophore ABC transporter substrate-binding protein n=1 Tax=Rhodococcus sp. NPDC058521 TaxID=3346536 RepID=UPI00366212E1